MQKLSNTNKSDIILEGKSSTKVSQLSSFLGNIFSFYNKKPVVAILRLEGILGKSLKQALKISSLNNLIEETFKIRNLEAVLLVINSPGGSPVQADLISSRIINLSKKTKIPVYSFVEDLAASGGYWLACIGEKIFAAQSSIVGSIGVISASFGLKELISKIGIERRIFSEGKNKSILDPFMPVKDEDIEIIKNIQKNVHQNFIEYVKSRRARTLKGSYDVLFNGEFWTSSEALSLGLIDGIDNIYSFIDTNYPKDVVVKHVGQKGSWIKKKLGLVCSNFDHVDLDTLVYKIQEMVIEDKFIFY